MPRYRSKWALQAGGRRVWSQGSTSKSTSNGATIGRPSVGRPWMPLWRPWRRTEATRAASSFEKRASEARFSSFLGCRGEFELPQNVRLAVGDTYFSGKILARMARLVAIGDELGKSGEDFFARMLEQLSEAMSKWLKKGAATPFIYDKSWGGEMAKGSKNPLESFGIL